MIRRLMPLALGAIYAGVPLFPAFITLTSDAFPGIAVLPAPLVLSAMCLVGLLAIYGLVALALYRKPGSQPLLLPALSISAASFVSALVGFNPAAGLLFVTLFSLGIIWHCCIVRFFEDPYVRPAIFWSFLVSGTIAAAAAMLMVVLREPASLYVIGHGRAIGTFVLPGELAAYLVVFLPIAYAVTRVAATRALQAMGWIAVAVGAVAMYMTHSRAGWMGLAAAIAIIVALQARRTLAGATGAAICVAAAAAAIALLFNANHNPSEDYTRVSIWQAAVEVIDRFPLTGAGPFDFSRVYPLVRVPDGEVSAFHAHSLYLTFFADLGILGLAAWAALAWALVAELRRRLPRAEPNSALLAIAAAAGLGGLAVQGLIDAMSIAIFGLLIPTMGLAVAAARVERPEAA